MDLTALIAYGRFKHLDWGKHLGSYDGDVNNRRDRSCHNSIAKYVGTICSAQRKGGEQQKCQECGNVPSDCCSITRREEESSRR